MSSTRPYCLAIAGFDPSGGAGIMADTKTFENIGVYGLGIVSALTFQNDDNFEGVKWVRFSDMEKQILPLKKFPVTVVKIGLVENMDVLFKLTEIIKKLFKDVFIVWDPIVKASAGFEFHQNTINLSNVLENIDLVTPNMPEYETLQFNKYLNFTNVLLKGGHNKENRGTDLLFSNEMQVEIPGEKFHDTIQKHGTGCVLSSAIATYVSMGNSLEKACEKAKRYTEKFMLSNPLKLGYHT